MVMVQRFQWMQNICCTSDVTKSTILAAQHQHKRNKRITHGLRCHHTYVTYIHNSHSCSQEENKKRIRHRHTHAHFIQQQNNEYIKKNGEISGGSSTISDLHRNKSVRKWSRTSVLLCERPVHSPFAKLVTDKCECLETHTERKHSAFYLFPIAAVTFSCCYCCSLIHFICGP